MARPYAGAARSTVVERPSGRLGKRAALVEQSGAVCLWSGFTHLRFATPARGSLHYLHRGRPSLAALPGRRSSRTVRAGVANLRCVKPMRRPFRYVLPNSRASLPSPPEQCAMIAVSSRNRGAWAPSTSTRGGRLIDDAA